MKGDRELRKLAADYLDGLVLFDSDVSPLDAPHRMILQVFLPLATMPTREAQRRRERGEVKVYEYKRLAVETARAESPNIPGHSYPIFRTCKWLTADDTRRLDRFMAAEQARRSEADAKTAAFEEADYHQALSDLGKSKKPF